MKAASKSKISPPSRAEWDSLSTPVRDAIAAWLETMIALLEQDGKRDASAFLRGMLDAYERVPLRPLSEQSPAYRRGVAHVWGEG